MISMPWFVQKFLSSVAMVAFIQDGSYIIQFYGGMNALIGHLHQHDALAVVHFEVVQGQEVVQGDDLVLIFRLCLVIEVISGKRASRCQ